MSSREEADGEEEDGSRSSDLSDDQEQEEEDEGDQPNLGFNLLFGNLGSNNEVEADWLDEVVLASSRVSPSGRECPLRSLTPYGYRMLGKRSKGLAETLRCRGLR